MTEDNDELIPVFIPMLAAVLLQKEDEKGSPLSYEEVIAIRDSAPCIMMRVEHAEKLCQTRGNDLCPENCWYDFQMLRRELGRKPDLEPGARFNQVDIHDTEFQQTVVEAQESLDQFRQLLPTDGTSLPMAMLKTRIVSGDQSAFLWLHSVRLNGRDFIASFFELPAGFTEFSVGDERPIAQQDVLDWAMNDDGNLHGGFSLRYVRQQMPEDERSSYDEYIGVTNYL